MDNSSNSHSRGIAHIILLLAIVVVAIGGVGYLMYQNGQVQKSDKLEIESQTTYNTHSYGKAVKENSINSPTTKRGAQTTNKNELKKIPVYIISLERKREFQNDDKNITDYLKNLFNLRFSKTIKLYRDTSTVAPEDPFQDTYYALGSSSDVELDEHYEDNFIKVAVEKLEDRKALEIYPYLENTTYCESDNDCRLGDVICGLQQIKGRYEYIGFTYGCGGDMNEDTDGNRCIETITYQKTKCIKNACTGVGEESECKPI